MGILDKVITVVHRSGGNDCGDDDISDMGDGESHRRIGRRGRDEVRNEGRGGSRSRSRNNTGNKVGDDDDDRGGRRKDRLERMIEGVVTGKIAVPERRRDEMRVVIASPPKRKSLSTLGSVFC